MTEKLIENKIKETLKKNRLFFFKVHGGQFQSSGLPDLVILYNGIFIGCEIKGPVGIVSPLQKYNLLVINKNQGIGIVVDDTNYKEFNKIFTEKGNYEDFKRLSERSFIKHTIVW